MIQEGLPLGVSITGVFVVTSDSYYALLECYELQDHLKLLLKDVEGNINEAWCFLFAL